MISPGGGGDGAAPPPPPPPQRRRTTWKPPRCNTPRCTAGKISGYNHCVKHGGGRRCARTGCTRSALYATPHCKTHADGTAPLHKKLRRAPTARRCSHRDCTTPAVYGGGITGRCSKHGGGKRCFTPECTKGAGKFNGRASDYCAKCARSCDEMVETAAQLLRLFDAKVDGDLDDGDDLLDLLPDEAVFGVALPDLTEDMAVPQYFISGPPATRVRTD